MWNTMDDDDPPKKKKKKEDKGAILPYVPSFAKICL